MATVHDVAKYILSKQGSISTMKLQKLVYYSQAWSLVWDERPLFVEPIQAWQNGPVVPDLYAEHRGQFSVSQWPKGDVNGLSADEKETIDVVLGAYEKLSGQELSELSHRESPWIEARGTTPTGGWSNAVISLDSMQQYYSGVASDASTVVV